MKILGVSRLVCTFHHIWCDRCARIMRCYRCILCQTPRSRVVNHISAFVAIYGHQRPSIADMGQI